MATGAVQKCRLFLEGREVPFVRASLMCRAGQPITAQIDLVPHQTIKFIRPKTQVQLFVKDTRAFGDSNFRLAFEGQVVGRGMTKSQGSRSFQVTVIDYTGEWDETKAYMYNHNFVLGKIDEVISGGVPIGTEKKAAGASTMTSSSTVNSAMISRILHVANQKGKDLIDGVVSVFQSLNNINLMYKATYARLRINDRIRIRTSGRLKHFLADLNIQSFLEGFVGRQGGLFSMRELLSSVMGLVLHEFVSVPFPSAVPLRKDPGATLGSAVGGALSSAIGGAVGGKAGSLVGSAIDGATGTTQGDVIGSTLGNFLFIPDAYTLPAPKCNVIFPNQIIDFQMTDDFRVAPTRFMFRASLPEFISGQVNITTYPALFYPKSFSRYMFKSGEVPDSELNSLLGPSNLLKSKAGVSYAQLKYGDKSSKAKGGVSIAPVLRESDFLTNEESIRGIFLDTEVFPPAITALVDKNKGVTRTKFFQEIGTYLYFKKRYGARNATANLVFSPFLVPGFNCVLMDESSAGQTLIAKAQTITHTLSNDGFVTSVELGYARDFDEVDALTGGAGEPPVPEWYDPSIFGSIDSTRYDEESAYLSSLGLLSDDEKTSRLKLRASAITYPKLSQFYQELLGIDAITDYDTRTKAKDKVKNALVTPRGAITYLSWQYHSWDESSREENIRQYCRRPIPTMADAMAFLGAQASGGGKSVPDEFATFVSMTTGPMAKRFDGLGFEDEDILKVRREVVDAYVSALKDHRGFRG